MDSYYVTVRDGGRVGFLVGPFSSHAEALGWVEPARKAARAVNIDAHWYAYGTAKVQGTRGSGRLNEMLGVGV